MYGTYDPYDEYMAGAAPPNFEPAQRVRESIRAREATQKPRYARGGGGSMGSGMTMAGVSSGNPYLALAGLGLEAFGTYQASEQAEEANRDAMEVFRDEQVRERRLDHQAEDQRRINNLVGFGNYARDLEKDTYGTYTPWARAQGL